MKLLQMGLVTLAIVGLMLVASASAWMWLPEGPIAIHFGFSGQPDNWAPKLVALLVIPALALGVSCIFGFYALLGPQEWGVQRSWRAFAVVWTWLLLFLAAIHGILIARSVSPDLPVLNLVYMLLGALFALIGNFAGKMRRNAIIGIRTPWTLANEEVWDKTHRLFGPLLMLGGLGLFVCAIVLREPQQLMASVLTAVVAPALIATVYSIAISPRRPQA